jgi:hypothetical protein
VPGTRLLAVVLAVGLMVLVPGAPAFAHDGPVTLEVAGDGATGVTARATYKEDGHAVEGVRLVLTATGEGGRTVGPLQLAPAPEGRGFYASGAVLTPGTWQVTVTAPAPHPGTATVRVAARAAQTPPPAPVAPSLREPAGRYGWVWFLSAALLVVAVLATVTVRRKTARR